MRILRKAGLDRDSLAVDILLDMGEDSLGSTEILSPSYKQTKILPIHHSDLSEYSSKSPLPRELREAKILDYDVDTFPFRKAIAEILNGNPNDLANIHETSSFYCCSLANF